MLIAVALLASLSSVHKRRGLQGKRRWNSVTAKTKLKLKDTTKYIEEY
jgi:hypothetical protein